MSPRSRLAAAAGGLLAAASLSGCELALHEVQRADAQGCDPWQAGCPPVTVYAQGETAQPPRFDLDRLEIVSQAIKAPHRRCDGVGLACQARIIGDVLWDQYVMVLAGRSEATSSAANAQSLLPGAPDAAAAAPSVEAQGRVIRTHGGRSVEPVNPASR